MHFAKHVNDISRWAQHTVEEVGLSPSSSITLVRNNFSELDVASMDIILSVHFFFSLSRSLCKE